MEPTDPTVAATAQPITAPMFAASGVQLAGFGNEILLTLTRARPSFATGQDGEQVQIAMAEPQAVISLSPQTAKDLHLILAGILQQWEAEFGNISTPFTTQRAANQAGAAKSA